VVAVVIGVTASLSRLSSLTGSLEALLMTMHAILLLVILHYPLR